MNEELKYISFGDSLVGLKDLDVLEVGGCISPNIVFEVNPKSWTSIDINSRRFDGKESKLKELGYIAKKMSVTKMDFEDNSFDRIFSINCFEHVDDMNNALSEMHRVLRPGGLLFSIFGPIWSSPVGHHTWVEHGGKLYHFGESVFPDWYHLLMNRNELNDFLSRKYGVEVSEKIVSYVYDSNDINRLCDGDFSRLFMNSDFRKQLMIFQKKGGRLSKAEVDVVSHKYPSVIDLRNTEILVVLSKGDLSLVSKLSIFKGLLKEAFKKIKVKIVG